MNTPLFSILTLALLTLSVDAETLIVSSDFTDDSFSSGSLGGQGTWSTGANTAVISPSVGAVFDGYEDNVSSAWSDASIVTPGETYTAVLTVGSYTYSDASPKNGPQFVSSISNSIDPNAPDPHEIGVALLRNGENYRLQVTTDWGSTPAGNPIVGGIQSFTVSPIFPDEAIGVDFSEGDLTTDVLSLAVSLTAGVDTDSWTLSATLQNVSTQNIVFEDYVTNDVTFDAPEDSVLYGAWTGGQSDGNQGIVANSRYALSFVFESGILSAGGVEATSIHLTADEQIEEVWINGVSLETAANSSDWSHSDNYGPQSNLRCLAVRVVDGSGTFDGVSWAGFLAAITLADDRWVTSDRTWKAYAGTPPLDAEGRSWQHPDYDDSAWPFATEAGAYGVGPWGTDAYGASYTGSGNADAPTANLDDDFRVTEFIGPPNPFFGDSYLLQNATWIWSGLSLEPTQEIYLRKVFESEAPGAPPNKPSNVRASNITANGFSLSWEPCFAPDGPVSYEIVWNGLPLLTTSDTEVTITDVSIGPYLQNYAYVHPISAAGIYGAPSAFVPIKTADTTSPSAVPNLRILEESNGVYSFAWDHATDNVGIDTYVLLLNGFTYTLPGHLTEARINLGTDLTEAPRIFARDYDFNSGPVSTAVAAEPVTDSPLAPVVRVAGRSDNSVVLRWNPGAPGTCSRYDIEIENSGGNWVTRVSIDDPRHGAWRLTSLSPNTTYRFRVVAVGDGEVAVSEPITVSTINPNPQNSQLRFGVLMSTDGKWTEMAAALADLRDAGCDFTLIKGQLVPQLSGKRSDWETLIQTVNDNKGGTMEVIYSPLGTKDIYPLVNDPFLNWSDESFGFAFRFSSRFDRFLLHTGQPLNQRYTALDGAFQLGTFAADPRGNPDFAYELEQTSISMEANTDCKWFVTSGLNSESYPNAIPGVIANLYRPSVEIMRMTNGNPGYAIDWLPGQNVVGITPQRNRAGGWFLIDVEESRLLIESRQLLADDSIATRGIEEILIDRQANVIEPQEVIVNTVGGGKTYGLPLTPAQGPVWTQNRIYSTKAGQAVNIRLRGRSTRGANLTYAVTDQPKHGTLSGSGDTLTYTPDPAFSGTDFFLYQADDSGGLAGNTAWVRIDVRAKSLYEEWLEGYFTAAQIEEGVLTAELADLDADGLPTILEYAFVGDPQVADTARQPRLVTVEIGGNRYWALDMVWRDFSGEEEDVGYALQTSYDLEEWDTVMQYEEEVGSSEIEGALSLMLIDVTRQADSDDARFLRLRVDLADE